MPVSNMKIALLIDADNISAKYIKTIFDELAKKGTVTYRRVYADWSSPRTGEWQKVLVEHSLTAIQQFPFTKGKNATDSAMIIDAMDILYRNDYLDAFCIATSDSDFTSITNKLREAGKYVIGMGEQKTPLAFVSACSEFKWLDAIEDDADESETESVVTSKKKIAEAVEDYIRSESGEVYTSTVKNFLKNKYPGFDERNYGYSKFSIFLNRFDNIETYEQDMKVRIKGMRVDSAEIYNYIDSLRLATKDKTINIGLLKSNIVKQYPHFNVKDYGYSSMKKFLQSILGITIEGDYAVLHKKSRK
ncbi:MAG: NYN domain-containing protein [Clostridiales bacterium]|nr:NYN domain-containing protein [Clostridia bacterium]MCR4564252.1 NYN domain-containing protein [Clostridiales bacterium]